MTAMNSDIRLAVGFPDHPKTVKLERRLGLQAVMSLIRLWLWAAQHRPGGVLSDMDMEDVEIAARWGGEIGVFADALLGLRFLDDDGGTLLLHDWGEHNPWQCGTEERADRARFSRLGQICPEEHARLKRDGVNAISRADYQMLTGARRASGDPPATARRHPGDSPAESRHGPGDVPAEGRDAPGEAPAPDPAPAPAPAPDLFPSPSPGPPPGPPRPGSPGEEKEREDARRLSLLMRDTLRGTLKLFPEPDLKAWEREFLEARRADARLEDAEHVAGIIRWACADPFWRGVVTRPDRLFRNFDTIAMKMEAETGGGRSPADRRVAMNVAAAREARGMLFGSPAANQEDDHDRTGF